MIKKIFKCDGCGYEQLEPVQDMGVRGWSGINGVMLNGSANPIFCPRCTTNIMEYVDKMAEKDLDK